MHVVPDVESTGRNVLPGVLVVAGDGPAVLWVRVRCADSSPGMMETGECPLQLEAGVLKRSSDEIERRERVERGAMRNGGHNANKACGNRCVASPHPGSIFICRISLRSCRRHRGNACAARLDFSILRAVACAVARLVTRKAQVLRSVLCNFFWRQPPCRLWRLRFLLVRMLSLTRNTYGAGPCLHRPVLRILATALTRRAVGGCIPILALADRPLWA